jgi:transcription elongation factor Elf1
MEEIEKKFKCPYCFEKISMVLDLSVDGTQTYIEDCEVCCRPIQITFTVEDYKLLSFSYQGAG